jgi:cytochrome c-type biogenesis protein CcmE
MKAKHKRLWLVVFSLSAVALGLAGILYAFNDNLVFFYTPSQLAEKKRDRAFDGSRPMRVGGLVKMHSVKSDGDGTLHFMVTDLNADLPVVYKGFVPTLFREGQGVVAQGILDEKGELVAQQILAKHDENYMPREVMEALKASGQWREEGGYQKKRRAP